MLTPNVKSYRQSNPTLLLLPPIYVLVWKCIRVAELNKRLTKMEAGAEVNLVKLDPKILPGTDSLAMAYILGSWTIQPNV